MTETELLEQICVRLKTDLHVSGVMIVTIHKNNRAELVTAIDATLEKNPREILEKLLESLRDGNGMPLGNDGKTMGS